MRQDKVEELNFETIRTARGSADELFQKTIKESCLVERAFEKNRSRLRRRIREVKTTWHQASRATWRQTSRKAWRPSRRGLLRLRQEGDMSTEQEAYTLMIAGTE